jgi:hypothetical protein
MATEVETTEREVVLVKEVTTPVRVVRSKARPTSAPIDAGRAAPRLRFSGPAVRWPWTTRSPGRASCSWPESRTGRRPSTTGRTWTDEVATRRLGVATDPMQSDGVRQALQLNESEVDESNRRVP